MMQYPYLADYVDIREIYRPNTDIVINPIKIKKDQFSLYDFFRRWFQIWNQFLSVRPNFELLYVDVPIYFLMGKIVPRIWGARGTATRLSRLQDERIAIPINEDLRGQSSPFSPIEAIWDLYT